MEAGLGYDFSRVRIHTDPDAAGSARAVHALAYTVGRDIVFGAGQYTPGTDGGKRLLAHELSHVLQQAAGPVDGNPISGGLKLSGSSDRWEQEATSNADRVMTSGRSTPLATPVIPLRRDAPCIQRAPDPALQPAPPSSADKVAEQQAALLETEILTDPIFKNLKEDSKARVLQIIAKAKTRPLGTGARERNYYLIKLKVALTTPFEGKETGEAKYGCSDTAEKENRKEVEEALRVEKEFWNIPHWANVEEKAVATGTHMVPRTGQDGKIFWVDRSDPRNIRVKMKVKLTGTADDVAKIQTLEDAIERESHTKGYYLDIQFVNKSGYDVFELDTNFCLWPNSGTWARGPTTLSHEAQHALGLPDRYDYIERHAGNPKMNVPMRLVFFVQQMDKIPNPRDPYSKMAKSSNPLLAEDVCAIAFKEPGPARKACIDARKDLDPAGVPPP